MPSTLMERGTSGRRLTAVFRKASAGGRQQNDEEREEGREVTRKRGREGTVEGEKEAGEEKKDLPMTKKNVESC